MPHYDDNSEPCWHDEKDWLVEVIMLPKDEDLGADFGIYGGAPLCSKLLPMLRLISLFFGAIGRILFRRQTLMENLALRQQVGAPQSGEPPMLGFDVSQRTIPRWTGRSNGRRLEVGRV